MWPSCYLEISLEIQLDTHGLWFSWGVSNLDPVMADSHKQFKWVYMINSLLKWWTSSPTTLDESTSYILAHFIIFESHIHHHKCKDESLCFLQKMQCTHWRIAIMRNWVLYSHLISHKISRICNVNTLASF